MIAATELLEREAVEPEPMDTLVDDAAKLLNYTIDEADNHLDHTIKGVLAQLNIKPFTTSSVERYKKEMLKRANHKVDSGWSAIGVGCILGLATALIGIPFWFFLGEAWRWITGTGLVTFVLSFASGFILTNLKEYTWEQFMLPIRAAAVPEFALQTAVDVAKALKQLKPNPVTGAHISPEFRVDLLTTKQIDPFLVLYGFDGRHYSKPYYLEVWNEPGYKQEREV